MFAALSVVTPGSWVDRCPVEAAALEAAALEAAALEAAAASKEPAVGWMMCSLGTGCSTSTRSGSASGTEADEKPPL